MREKGSEPPEKSPRRWRKTGDIDDVKRVAWRAIKLAEHVAYDEGATKSEMLSASARMTQAVQAYLKVLEAGELEERVAAIEATLEARKNGIHVN